MCKILRLLRYIGIFLMGSVFCFSQTDSTQIPFVAYWSVRDNYDYFVTKIRKSWNGDELENKDSTTYFSTFSVIDSTENSYRIKWINKSNLGIIPPEFADLLNNNATTIEYIYRTNELGEFEELENWQELSDFLISYTNELIVLALKNNSQTSKDQLQKALQPFLSIYKTREGIESIVLKELTYFHFPFGALLNSNEVLEYEDQIPNILGEGTMRGDSKIYFDHVDLENGFCSFTYEMKINEEDALEMLFDLLTKMGVNDDKNLKELKNAKYLIEDHHYFEIFYDPGVPYFIEAKRNIDISTQEVKKKREEIVRIELILD